MHGRTNEGPLALARQLTGILRRREQLFGRNAINEVQWEMLLRLLAEGGDRCSLCERSLLVGGGTSAAAAAQQLDRLVDDGIVWRIGGMGCDDRRQILLTSATRSRILRVLGGIGAFADDVRTDLMANAGSLSAVDHR